MICFRQIAPHFLRERERNCSSCILILKKSWYKYFLGFMQQTFHLLNICYFWRMILFNIRKLTYFSKPFGIVLMHQVYLLLHFEFVHTWFYCQSFSERSYWNRLFSFYWSSLQGHIISWQVCERECTLSWNTVICHLVYDALCIHIWIYVFLRKTICFSE